MGFCIQPKKTSVLLPLLDFGQRQTTGLQWISAVAESEGKSLSPIVSGENEVCFYSEPEFLFVQERGQKFQLCLPGIQVEVEKAFMAEDYWDQGPLKSLPKKLFEDKLNKQEFKPIWGRAISTSLFSFPLVVGVLYESTKSKCIYAYPAEFRKNEGITFLEFDCDEKTLDGIPETKKNDICEEMPPLLTESFRSSSSPWRAFLEFQNTRDQISCKLNGTLSFVPRDPSRAIANQRLEIPALLPGAIFLALPLDLSPEILDSIGSNGTWVWQGQVIGKEIDFRFHHEGGFVSYSRNKTSCQEQLNPFYEERPFCGNPGIPNRIWKKGLSCDVSTLFLTEFFPGGEIPVWIELTNFGDKPCPLADLEIEWDEDSIPLGIHSKKRVIRPKETLVLGREDSFGLGEKFQFTVLPTKVWDYGLPSIRLISRSSNQLNQVNISSIPLYRKIGGETRSLQSISSILIPFYPLSPGFLNPIKMELGSFEISELLLDSPRFENRSSPDDRFLELKMIKPGFGSVVLENTRYDFYSDQSEEFPFFSEKKGNCLPKKYQILPPNPFSGSFSKIELNGMGFVLGQDEKASNGRRSIHPEREPMGFSKSSGIGLSELCQGNATPGSANKKEADVRSTRAGNYQTIDDAQLNRIFSLSGENRSGEVVFSEWLLDGNLAWRIHKEGAIRIHSFSLTPKNSQNEWIRFCNTTKQPIPIRELFVQDENSSDFLLPYDRRFPEKKPFLVGNERFDFTSETLNECAILLDPDASGVSLNPSIFGHDLVVTIVSGGTIGNGLSPDESFQIVRQTSSGSTILSTYGRVGDKVAFRFNWSRGKIAVLKDSRNGDVPQDFLSVEEE